MIPRGKCAGNCYERGGTAVGDVVIEARPLWEPLVLVVDNISSLPLSVPDWLFGLDIACAAGTKRF